MQRYIGVTKLELKIQANMDGLAPKGKTPVKETIAKRLSINMISTITNQGKVRFMTYKGIMNTQRFIVLSKKAY